MKAVIPAARKKDDMFPFSESKPTALMPVNGKPLILQTIGKLKAAGIEEVNVIVNHREELFRQLLQEREDVNIVVQEELSGTAEALKTCEFLQEDFVAVNGDVAVSEEDLEKLVESHSGDVSMLSTDESKPEKFGVLSIQNDEVTGIEEKPEEPENTLVNTGIYAFTPEIFDLIKASEASSITEIISENLEDLDCRFSLIEDYWFDIGSPKKLLQADKTLRVESGRNISESAEIHESADLFDGVEVRENAVVGPNCILKDCIIGEGAEIRGNTVVEASTVGPRSLLQACHVKDSLLFEETVLDSFVDVEQSVLGEETDVKSGTVMKEAFIGPRSYVDMNNSIRGVKFVPDARTDLSEISK
ncbi:MAG: sugar phosphate nucleotidyltransferase [Candidatus Nanohaloarchaea archaeon]